MIRFLLYIVLIIFLGRIAKSMLKSPPPSAEVHGRPEKEPLDLSRSDIEDVEFKEIKE